MKKVTLTIKREQTYTIEFDENKLNKEFIEEWSKYITDITEEPEELSCYVVDHNITEGDYPYLNLAKSVAYNVMVNDCDHIEGLEFQHVMDNDFMTIKPDRENYAAWYEQIGYPDTEYEFDFDSTEL